MAIISGVIWGFLTFYLFDTVHVIDGMLQDFQGFSSRVISCGQYNAQKRNALIYGRKSAYRFEEFADFTGGGRTSGHAAPIEGFQQSAKHLPKYTKQWARRRRGFALDLKLRTPATSASGSTGMITRRQQTI
jgi:hypothetical protein